MLRFIVLLIIVNTCGCAAQVDPARQGDWLPSEAEVMDQVVYEWQQQGRPWNEEACTERPSVSYDPEEFSDRCPGASEYVVGCYLHEQKAITLRGTDDWEYRLAHETIHWLCHCTRSCSFAANNGHQDGSLWTVLHNATMCHLGQEQYCSYSWAGMDIEVQ